MNVTDHSHVPFVIILVRALEEWKKKVSHRPKYMTINANRT